MKMNKCQLLQRAGGGKIVLNDLSILGFRARLCIVKADHYGPTIVWIFYHLYLH